MVSGGFLAFHLVTEQAVADHQIRVANAERAYDALYSDAETMRSLFRAEVDALAASNGQTERRYQLLERQHRALMAQVQMLENDLAARDLERNAALMETSQLAGLLGADGSLVQVAANDPVPLANRLAALRAQIKEKLDERERAEQELKGLDWRLNFAEQRLSNVRKSHGAAVSWLAEWFRDYGDSVLAVLSDNGVDVEPLVSRVMDDAQSGIGGPFEALPGDEPVSFAEDSNRLAVELERVEAIETVLGVLPLAAPLDHFHVTSGYGPRVDPIKGSKAMHSGIDLGAARNSKIMATAPGTVRHAGDKGPFGIMVEIEHGFGIVTRFAHLAEATVKVGDRVDRRDVIGIIGSTGRSTGRHLHYEVRIDDRPQDPSLFLRAGRQLINVFKS